MPNVIETAIRFRNQLGNLETSSVNDLTSTYGRLVNRLEDKLTVLMSRIEVLESQGNLTPESVRKQAVWSSLLNQIEDEIKRYGGFVSTQSDLAAQKSIDLASKHSRLLTQVHFQDNQNLLQAFNATWDTLPTDSIQTLLGFLQADSQLHINLQKSLGVNAAQNFQNKLLEGIALGYNPVKINQLINQSLGEPLTWSLNSIRTTQNYAYREATRANYVNNSEIVGGWKWFAALDDRVCLSCVNQHGKDFPVNASLNDHHQGRCTQIPLVDKPERFGLKPIEVQKGEDWFTALPKDQQIERMGQARFKAYQQGKFQFGDLSEKYQNDTFGEMLKERSLKSLLTLPKLKTTKVQKLSNPKVIDQKKSEPIKLPPNRRYSRDQFRIDTSLQNIEKDVNIALDMIDRVHGFSKIADKTPIKSLTYKGLEKAEGVFIGNPDGTAQIQVNLKANRPTETTLHEIGHFIETHVLGNNISVVEKSADFKDWRTAIENSSAFKQLQDMLANPTNYKVSTTTGELKPDKKYLQYILQYDELWARSYMQYIVRKNGEEDRINFYLADKLFSAKQWESKDFDPIEKAFDNYFGKIKWK